MCLNKTLVSNQQTHTHTGAPLSSLTHPLQGLLSAKVSHQFWMLEFTSCWHQRGLVCEDGNTKAFRTVVFMYQWQTVDTRLFVFYMWTLTSLWTYAVLLVAINSVPWRKLFILEGKEQIEMLRGRFTIAICFNMVNLKARAIYEAWHN